MQEKICRNEHLETIEFKLKLLKRIRESTSTQLSKELVVIYDSIPDEKTRILVERKCTKCIFPNCNTAKMLLAYFEKIDNQSTLLSTII